MEKTISWSADKNSILISSRHISFEEIVFHLDNNGLIDDKPHPNIRKYPNQRVFAVLVNDYIYIVPYTEEEDKIFLKTIIPSRKATKQYLRAVKDE